MSTVDVGRVWVGVGVDYCTVHAGIRNEDEPRCDFAGTDEEPLEDGEPRPCRLYELVYDPTAEPRIEPPPDVSDIGSSILPPERQ